MGGGVKMCVEVQKNRKEEKDVQKEDATDTTAGRLGQRAARAVANKSRTLSTKVCV